MHGSVSLTHGSKKSTVPPEVAQVDPSRTIHTSPRVYMRQQTCLLCDTADCCVTQYTCLLCGTPDMSAVRHNRHVGCVIQQTCLLCDATDMSAV